MLYILSLAVSLLSAAVDMGILIAEGALVVGAGAAVTTLGVKIGKKKKALAKAKEEEKTEEVVEETTEEVTEEVVEEATEEVTEEVVEEATEEVTEEVVEETTEEVTEEVVEEATEEVTEEVVEEATEEVTEEVAKETTEEITEDTQVINDFEKYESPNSDAEELKRHLEDSKAGANDAQPYESTGSQQSWDQVKDYNAAVMPVVLATDGDEENEEAEAEQGDELTVIYDDDGNAIQLSYRRSFRAKVIQADKVLKDYYALISAELLSYKKIKSRLSWSCETFNYGRKAMAKMVVRGKTLVLYLALDPAKYEGTKYFFKDMSEKRKYADVPMMVKIKSTRAVKYAKELIAATMADTVRLDVDQKLEEIPYEKTSALVGKGLIKVIANGGKAELSDELMQRIAATEDKDGARYKMSFMAKLIRSDEQVKSYYSAIKNELLSYKKVKPRLSWACETFNLGRDAKAKVAIRGKSLYLYLALDPKEFEGTKYFFKDLSAKKKYAAVPMLVKVKSDRGLKYAKELIDRMLDGITKLDIEQVDYTHDYQDMGKLIKDGWVKELPEDDEE